jgi:hypothetical protein
MPSRPSKKPAKESPHANMRAFGFAQRGMPMSDGHKPNPRPFTKKPPSTPHQGRQGSA